MKINFLSFVATIIFLSFFKTASSQTSPSVTDLSLLSTKISSSSPSSGGGDLSQYLDYKTGSAAYEITLFNVEENGYTLPVKIRYNSSGHKVDHLASPVGLNWDLSVGGKVKRTVRQLPDEFTDIDTTDYSNFTIYDTDKGGWIHNTADVNHYKTEFANIYQTSSGTGDDYLGIIYGNIDLAPDQFSLNLPSASIDYTLEHSTGNFKPNNKQYEDWKMTSNLQYDMPTSSYWSFTDPSGTKYDFGEAKNGYSFLYQADSWAGRDEFNDFFLTNIDVINSDTNFEFKYDSKVSYPMQSSVYQTRRKREESSTCLTGLLDSCYVFESDELIHNSGDYLMDTIISNHYMVTFSYSDYVPTSNYQYVRHQLDTIKLNLLNGSNLRTIVFNYDNTHLAKGKPYLTEIVQVDANNNKEYLYRFDYIDKSNTPSNNTNSQDLFGFYNGANNTTLVLDEENNIYPNRNLNLQNMQVGMLSSIESKYKGTVEYAYEENLDNGKYFGGVRVRQIIYDDDNGNIANYIVNFNNPIGRAVDINNSDKDYLCPSINSLTSFIFPHEFSCNEVDYQTCYSYLSTTDIVADNVTQEQGIEVLNQEGGFFYQNVSITYPDNNGSRELVYNKIDHSPMVTGMLVNTKDKDNNGNILNETINTYANVESESTEYIKIESVKGGCTSGGTGIGGQYNGINAAYTYTSHQQRTQWYQLQSTEQVVNGQVSILTNFEYDTSSPPNHHFVKKKKSVNSDGKLHETEFFHLDSYPHNSFMSLLMGSKNMFLPIWKTEKRVDNVLVDGKETIMSYFAPNGNSTVVVSEDILPFEFSRYEQTWDANGALSTGIWELQKTINAYTNGNPKEVTKKNWNTEYYTWMDDLLLNKSFNSHQESYEYYSENRLLKSKTDIDSQTIDYEYDGFLRINKIKERNNNVVTDIDYRFKETIDPSSYSLYSYVDTKITYPSSSNTNNATGNSELVNLHTRQYLDGLGREKQSIKIGYSPNQKDVIYAVTYDKLGRVSRQYEPYEATTANGEYNTSFTTNPFYTLTEYEPSPLGRIFSVKAPLWSFRTYYNYGSNSTGTISDNVSGYNYPSNSLIKTEVIDQNGNKSISYTDKRQHTLQIDETNSTETEIISTKNTYDDKDRLIFTFPPDVDYSQTDLYYKYRFDGADNMIEKKVPDSEPVMFIHNDRDLVSGMRNRLLDIEYKWLVTHYDDFGRITKTGFHNGIVPSNYNIPTIDELLTENFYDGNSFNGSNNTTSSQYTGRLRESRVKILENNSTTNTWLNTVFYYDTYGRSIIESGNHILNTSTSGSTLSTYSYDFADNVMTSNTVQTTNAILSKRERYYYDHSGRITDTYHKIGSNQEEHLYNKNYTVKDQLEELNLGGTTSTALQSIDFTYNAQGWLQSINNPDDGMALSSIPTCMTTASSYTSAVNNMSVSNNPDDNDLFHLKLSYGYSNPAYGFTAPLNGNVAEMSWRTKLAERQSYGFEYDYLDRLTTATYAKYDDGFNPAIDVTNDYSTSYNYDDRGNILSLTRQGKKMLGDDCYEQGTIDSLEYHYYPNTNQLQNVIDKVSITSCPPNLMIDIPMTDSGVYDADDWVKGSETLDEDVDITYQANNCVELLPGFSFDPTMGTGEFLAHILNCNQFSSPLDLASGGFYQTSITNYTYDGNGNTSCDPNKAFDFFYNHLNLPYKAVSSDGTKEIQWEYDANGRKLKKTILSNGNTIYQQDYWQGFQYKNSTIEAIYHEQGRVFNTNIQNGGTPNWQYEYHLIDHLGNTRVTFSDKDANGLIEGNEWIETIQYYPFGLEHEGMFRENTDTPETYLFGGKEIENDFSLDVSDFGWRRLDKKICRWNSVDPLANDYASVSTYTYVSNNPIRYTDPDGASQDDFVIVDEHGNEVDRIPFPGEDIIISNLPDVTVTGERPERWRVDKEYMSDRDFYEYLENRPEAQRQVLQGDFGHNHASKYLIHHMQNSRANHIALHVFTGMLSLVQPSQAIGLSLGSSSVNLASKMRTVHILAGDATGGGHAWFASLQAFKNGITGVKSMFPASWSKSKIMHAVSEVATSNPWVQQTGKAGANFTRSGKPVRYRVEGTYEGVKMRVITTGDDIITAFPIK